jgi:hypothetical protein
MLDKLIESCKNMLSDITGKPRHAKATRELIERMIARGPSGTLRVAYAARAPFLLNPKRTARDMKKLIPDEHLAAVKKHLYFLLDGGLTEEKFESYFR